MKNILVIEDTVEVRSLITETLKVHGYQTMAAEDGISGIELAEKHLPDLILCDINMPKLNGYGTLSTLRQKTNTAAIPFIFLTGVADKENMRHGMELGADDYLTKPFTLAELVAAVKARLDKQATITRQSERKLEELRGNISFALPHELITPLNGVIGFSSLLVEHYGSLRPEEILDFGRNIQEAAMRLQRLVENFLIYSQIEVVAASPDRVQSLRKGEARPTREKIESVAAQFGRRHNRVEDLRLELNEAFIPVANDKFEKILSELIDNAFKFSKKGNPITIISHRNDKAFLLVVEDCGRGMTPDQITKIGAHMQFERKFYEQQGSGLGLIIAKRLIELHGGQLLIESDPGKLTRTKVLIPLQAHRS